MNGFGVSPLEIMASEAMLQGLVYLDEFIYSASWVASTATALGASATTEVQILINGDSDFLVQEMNLTAFAGGAIIASPNYLLTVIRAGSGREVMNQAQHVLNVCGGYQATRFPGKKPIPGLLNASNTITCRLQNLTATAADRVDLALIGFKVFYTQNNEGQQGTRAGVFHL